MSCLGCSCCCCCCCCCCFRLHRCHQDNMHPGSAGGSATYDTFIVLVLVKTEMSRYPYLGKNEKSCTLRFIQTRFAVSFFDYAAGPYIPARQTCGAITQLERNNPPHRSTRHTTMIAQRQDQTLSSAASYPGRPRAPGHHHLRAAAMPQALPPKCSAGTHADMCTESLPRRPHTATFDDALSALKLAPAANGRGAVLDGWTDPIGAHDKKVLEVEQAMLEEKDLVSVATHVARRHPFCIVYTNGSGSPTRTRSSEVFTSFLYST